MAIIQKFVEQTDWLWYNAELTDEQIAQYRHQMVELGLMPRLQSIYEKN